MKYTIVLERISTRRMQVEVDTDTPQEAIRQVQDKDAAGGFAREWKETQPEVDTDYWVQ